MAICHLSRSAGVSKSALVRRERDDEGCALARLAFQPDLPLQNDLDDVVDQGQAQTHAALPHSGGEEWVEYPALQLLGDAFSIVRVDQDQFFLIAADVDADAADAFSSKPWVSELATRWESSCSSALG